MSADVNISALLDGLRRASDAQLAAARQALGEFAQHTIGDAQVLTPVDTEALQDSGIALPVTGDRDGISAELGFNTSYAMAVHERLELNHPVGQAKYLETALRNKAPKLGPHVAGAMKGAING